MARHTAPRVIYRYLSGRPLDGRTGYPYWTRGAARWPGWRRQLLRLGVPAAAGMTAAEPREVATLAGVLAAGAVWRGRRRWVRRRFRRAYIAPTLAALDIPLAGARVRLHVDPGLGTLMPRLAKPLSPAEVAVREWYGQRLEPTVRWPGDTAMRAWWTVQRVCVPVGRRLQVFRRPGVDHGPRIELAIATPYLTREQRQLVSSIIGAKIPAGDLIETWDQVGADVTARWTVRRRPPTAVGVGELLAALPGLAEWEYYLGAGVDGAPVVLSLQDDSPHLALSAGTGAGKSVFAQLVAVQVLARGGQVVILDRKGSHRWAQGLAGVEYCLRPQQMHDALVRVAGVADERNTRAFYEEEGWDPGPRVLVIAEELNATIGQLTKLWADIRTSDDPKKSPAVDALGEILFMGRSAKVNMLAIAQMLTARAIGGPEARENFGVRALARYTVNAWKMLVPEASMPRPSRTRGRWQIVVGGVATECQVAFLTRAEARRIAGVTGAPGGLDSSLSSAVTGNGAEPVTDRPISLAEAVADGVLPWPSKAAAKMRLHRARAAGEPVPAPVGRRGLQTDLYRREDLAAWATRSSTPTPEGADAA